MKKFLIALAFLPFAAGIASASEALTDQQMDRVTAGGSDSDGQGVCALWLEFLSHIRHFNYSVATAADSGGQNVSTSHSSSSSP